MAPPVVLDVAGGGIGGAARWVAELEEFLSYSRDPVSVMGRGRPMTASWMLHRERCAAGAGIAVAANNVSFVLAASERRVVVRNALHFLYPSEQHLLDGMARSFRAQIPVVRRLLSRADTIVAPCSVMAERVKRHVPAVRDRITVRPHPVTPVGSRLVADPPFILVPVLPAPYKNLLPQLTDLVATLDRLQRPIKVRVTAHPAELGTLAAHARVIALGTVQHRVLAGLWRYAAAIFFPSSVESFGYPLAEARVNGVPVLAPDSPQAREIAGKALLAYRPDDPGSLAEALDRIDEPVAAEPHAFDRDAYFRCLFGSTI